MIARRDLLAGLAMLPATLRAQEALPRIAILGMGPRQRQFAMLERSLREVGLTPGSTIVLETFDDAGDYRSFPRLAAEAMRRPPKLFLAPTIGAVQAAQAVAPSTPVVMISINDPVGAGLVKSLAQPGGMVTGLATSNQDTIGKVIELTLEALPGARSFAVVHNPLNPSSQHMLATIEGALSSRGGQMTPIAISERAEAGGLADRLARARSDVAVAIPDYALAQMAGPVAQAALAARVPLSATLRLFADAGGLFAYGFDYASATRRAASYAKRILAGARPADLPIEQPTHFILVVNLKTAAALGVALPPTLLARADELIE